RVKSLHVGICDSEKVVTICVNSRMLQTHSLQGIGRYGISYFQAFQPRVGCVFSPSWAFGIHSTYILHQTGSGPNARDPLAVWNVRISFVPPVKEIGWMIAFCPEKCRIRMGKPHGIPTRPL